jgi:hypothetical protein
VHGAKKYENADINDINNAFIVFNGYRYPILLTYFSLQTPTSLIIPRHSAADK